MQRIVLIVAALFVLWRLLTALGKRSATTRRGAEDFSRFSAKSRDRRREAARRRDDGGDLVACHHCQTMIPASRAVTVGSSGTFCSQACAAAHEEPGAVSRS